MMCSPLVLRLSRTIAACGVFALAPSCDKDEAAAPAPSAAAVTPKVDEEASEPGVAEPPAAKAGAAGGGECPKGTWVYDLSDRYMESVAANAPDLEVKSKKGSLICTISDNTKGSFDCAAEEGGVSYTFESRVAGMTMQMNIDISGNSKAKFEASGGSRMKIVEIDTKNLDVDSKMTLNGKSMPVPNLDLFPGLDKAGGEFEYQCEGDTLKWKPVAQGLKTDWAHMKRAP
jgi:hypothetical protein